MDAEFLFMEDNSRPHRANIVDECLQSEDITRIDCPAYSPDLNPIEHVWDMLGRRIAARQTPPTCLPELRRTLLDEWCNIPQDQIDNLIFSMPRHCVKVSLDLTLRTRINRSHLSGYGHELVAGVSWARVLLPLKTRRVDEAIPPADVVFRKEGFQLRCPPRHSTKAQNYEVCDQ
ncbi:transposable element Tcb2 transposase [Trichonephila clavipes]|nr:transposable element Tcb2 transposase [Trichonephila clavipes]